MRLDKFLCDTAGLTRTEAKNAVKKGQIAVNGQVQKAADFKVKETTDTVTFQGKPLSYAAFHYYMLHKPAGVITATEDKKESTVMDILREEKVKNLFPVGRLDKDTEGLLLVTDDGELAHNLLSPKKHVDKEYLVKVRDSISEEDCRKLSEGVDIGDEKPTAPAKVERVAEKEILLTIREGRFHQVKRMLQAVGNEVLYLKRLSMGSLRLPEDLEKGAYRPLSEEELYKIKGDK
ncbi:MAG: 16S rRNA pseudouridine(516) synthase [Clostridium sp.]|nr:16S rRNA pseudouridine(516) synthase [Clostridium sp.]CDA69499.1 pseudouridine synthase [Clostridium sp. CAG:510]